MGVRVNFSICSVMYSWWNSKSCTTSKFDKTCMGFTSGLLEILEGKGGKISMSSLVELEIFTLLSKISLCCDVMHIQGKFLYFEQFTVLG